MLTVRCEWERETSGESDGPVAAGDASDLVEGPAAAREGRRECVRELADVGPEVKDVGMERRETDLSAIPAPVLQSSRAEGSGCGGERAESTSPSTVAASAAVAQARSLQAPDRALSRPPSPHRGGTRRLSSHNPGAHHSLPKTATNTMIFDCLRRLGALYPPTTK